MKGKLDGVVNVHTNGKTAHAIFVDGKRSSRWTPGRAPSQWAIAKQLEKVRQRAGKKEKSTEEKEASSIASAESSPKPETASATTEKAGSLSETSSLAATGAAASGTKAKENQPAETTASTYTSSTVGDAGMPTGPVEQALPELPPAPNVDSASSQSQSDPSWHLTLNPQDAVSESPAEGPGTPASSTQAAPSPAPASEGSHESAGHKSANVPAKGLVGYREEKETKPTVQPSAKPAPSVAKSSATAKKEEIDDSVKMMMQPPSSLRANSSGDAAPTDESRLTREEVIGVADTAARAAGYDLNKYSRPRPEFNVAAGRWSRSTIKRRRLKTAAVNRSVYGWTTRRKKHRSLAACNETSELGIEVREIRRLFFPGRAGPW